MDWKLLINPSRRREEDQKLQKNDGARNRFEQDYDRIIFSYPFRRMQDKTQVFPLPETDFVHTRLTHSLEVSSVARSLGKLAGDTIIKRHPVLKRNGMTSHHFGAITGAAALAHDIGNPPFGHSGEEAISDFFRNSDTGKKIKPLLTEKQWADITNFDGNAQGFRLLNKKGFQGLSLTYSTLAAFSKYPRESIITNPDPRRRSQKKSGFFQSEKEFFTRVAESAGLIQLGKENLVWCRHPLVFLVEAADDICYSIIDLEDGGNLGLIPLPVIKNLVQPIVRDKLNKVKFRSLRDKREKAGLLRALAISALIDEVNEVFLDHETDILTGDFDQSITSIIPSAKPLKKIIDVSIREIYRSERVRETEAAGFEVLYGLLDSFVPAGLDVLEKKSNCSKRSKTIYNLFPTHLQDFIRSADSCYPVIMMTLDHIAGMTDTTALQTYRLIKGISLPLK